MKSIHCKHTFFIIIIIKALEFNLWQVWAKVWAKAWAKACEEGGHYSPDLQAAQLQSHPIADLTRVELHVIAANLPGNQALLTKRALQSSKEILLPAAPLTC